MSGTVDPGFWFGPAHITTQYYIELSIAGRIILSLANLDFQKGHLGIYADSCSLSVTNLSLHPMREPEQRDGQLIGS